LDVKHAGSSGKQNFPIVNFCF